MASSLASGPFPAEQTASFSLPMLIQVRLYTGVLLLLSSIVMLLGTAWDIQWHSFVGRDRTLIPPHSMMLTGIALAGIVALASVVGETLLRRRYPLLTLYGTTFAGIFTAPLGVYLAGFATLCAAVAFPLDSYWHAINGIDVAVWAPFHVMLLLSAGVVPLGAAMLLFSTAQLASAAQMPRFKLIAYDTALISFAVLLGLFTLLLTGASDDTGFVSFGAITILLFVPLGCLVTAWILVSVRSAFSGPRVTTYVVLIYLFFGALFQLFVPLATSWLVQSEHLTYRHDMAELINSSIIAVRFWSLTPLISAVLLDFFSWRARKNSWSLRRLTLAQMFAAFLAGLPIFVLIPLLPVILPFALGLPGFLISLVLGLLAAFIGTHLGQRQGNTLREGRQDFVLPLLLQKALLLSALVAFVVLIIEIVLSLSALGHAATPARVAHVNAGPYSLVVSLYRDPATAGFTLPFHVALAKPTGDLPVVNISTIPTQGVDATPVRATLSSVTLSGIGIDGAAEIPVKGLWQLSIAADGAAGSGTVNIPVQATAPPAIPAWLAWQIGLLPLYALILFLVLSTLPARRSTPSIPIEDV